MAWYNPLSWFGTGGDTVQTGTQKTFPTNGEKVSDFDTTMTQSVAWAGFRLLAETVASMPIIPYKTDLTKGTKVVDYSNELWRLINYKPNRYQTKTEFIEQIMLNLSAWGNSYVSVERTPSGRIISLMPYPTSQIETVLLDDGAIVHEYTDPLGNVKVFSSESMWHMKLFGNGLVGLSTLQYMSGATTLSKDLSDRQNKLAANGGKTNGILTVDQAMTKEQKEQVRKSFAGLEEGNSTELFVLEAGFNYQQASLSPTDMQLLESRKYSAEELARFIGVPSVLINDQTASTWGSGIEQINMGFYKLNLKPYLERFEKSWKIWLMNPKDWETCDIEFDFDSLLRADAATRAETNSKKINSGQITPNEARMSEGLPPEEGGDKIYLNGSLIPAGTNPANTMVNTNEQ